MDLYTEKPLPEKESYLKNMEKFDDIRALEMKEIQEEEVYINNLKKQREKVLFIFLGA